MNSLDKRWVVDYEFLADGNPPRPICYVAQNVDTGEIIRHWITGKEASPEYPTDNDTLFVAYFASAELGCHISLNFPRPANVLDLYAEFRCTTNGLILPSGRGLVGAMNYYRLPGADAEYKDMMRERIMQGPPYNEEEQVHILDYCQKDVELTAKLFKHMEGSIDLDRALLRGRYTWAVAMMEWTGVPLDLDALIILTREWDNIKSKLIELVDQDYGVYENGVFKSRKFLEYLQRNNIPWDLTESGLPKLDNEYMKEQAKTYPKLKPLQELRYSLSQLRLASIPVGHDGRNRTLLSPFQSKTGRNQPSSTRFIFGNAVWLRSLIKPREGMALAYIDFEQQEIAIAAALSGDEALKQAYETGDPYVSFAKAAGKIPSDGNKNTHSEIREKFKTCMLALNYGMSEQGFAKRSGLLLVEAKAMFKAHRQTYNRYWEYITNFADVGLLSGHVVTRYGWHCDTTNMTYRSLQNFPMQAHGADILRLASILCLENGIQVVAPVHDALLVEAPLSQIEHDVEVARFLMTKASEHVIGYPIRTDVKIIRYPDRYMDKRGSVMWNHVWNLLGSDKTPNITPQQGKSDQELSIKERRVL